MRRHRSEFVESSDCIKVEMWIGAREKVDEKGKGSGKGRTEEIFLVLVNVCGTDLTSLPFSLFPSLLLSLSPLPCLSPALVRRIKARHFQLEDGTTDKGGPGSGIIVLWDYLSLFSWASCVSGRGRGKFESSREKEAGFEMNQEEEEEK